MSRLFSFGWMPALAALAFVPSSSSSASWAAGNSLRASETVHASPHAGPGSVYHLTALALRGGGGHGGGGHGGGGGGGHSFSAGPSFRGGGDRGGGVRSFSAAPSFRGGERSFSVPSRSFSVPSRSFSAPSRSFSAPSRSFSAPSNAFSAPSRSFDARSFNRDRSDATANRFAGPRIADSRHFEGDRDHDGREYHDGHDRGDHHDRDHGFQRNFFYPYWAYGGWPYYSLYGGYYPYNYGYYSYPYYGSYGYPYSYGYDYYGYPYSSYPYSYDYGYSVGYGDYDLNSTPQSSATSVGSSQYYSDAVAAFQQGNYNDAVRWAEHAAVDSPQTPMVHVLLAQSLLATGDYRAAAMEAHAAAASGQVVDWATLYGLYGNVATFTNQLRNLEGYVDQNPSVPEGHFLLGYQYMILGHQQNARNELAEAVRLAPNDKLAQQLLNQLGSNTGQPSLPQSAAPANTGVQGGQGY